MIKILSQNIINKIAAGEVVERPASVVKELIENSIDAGAKEIQIFIEEFGTKKIQVIDNGFGISKSDFKNLFHKHATSKIEAIEDLDQIRSFGFRGEALASISSVSEIHLQTRHASDDIGSEIISINSIIEQNKPSSIISGTNLRVMKLFGNIPARKKFLKSKSTENKKIIEIINKFLIANPDIYFKYNIDGNEKEFIADDPVNRISKVLKINAENLIVINIDSKIKISGLLIHPKVFVKGKDLQHIFVNSRIINDIIIMKAIRDGYDNFLMKNQYPGFVLFIDLPPESVDINVHPRKTEVRFENSSEVYSSVRFGINNTLMKYISSQTRTKIAAESFQEYNSDLQKKISEPNQKYISDKNSHSKIAEEFENFLNKKTHNGYADNLQAPNRVLLTQKALEFSEEIIQVPLSEMNMKKTHSQLNLDLENATQLLNSYIITSNNNEILMIDQHAASERYFYERYLKNLKNRIIDSQLLLFPEVYSFDQCDIDVILKYTSKFDNLGFTIEEFGKDQIRISRVPAFIKLKDFDRVFKRIISDILENEDISNIEENINHEIAAMLACHTAVRFGDKLSKEEIHKILHNLLLCDDPYNCPHGRPIIQDHTQYEIEKRFKRCGL